MIADGVFPIPVAVPIVIAAVLVPALFEIIWMGFGSNFFGDFLEAIPHVARSRSEALAWCVRLVGKHQADWISELREALVRVGELRRRGPA